MFTTCKRYIGKDDLYVFSAHKEGENELVTLSSVQKCEFAGYAQCVRLASFNVQS